MPKVTSNDGTVITYDKKGEGPMLIMVLGALNKRGSGKKLAALLADKFTVISYDRRGRGDSSDVQPYSVEKEIDDLNALIDELGGCACLYGHSSGAVLALLAAKKLVTKVLKLAIYELPYNDDPEALKASEAYKKELKKLLAEDKRGDAVELFVKLFGVTDRQIAAMKRLPMWKGLIAMAPTLAYDTIELMEQYSVVSVREVKTPMLIMYGAESPQFMGETAQELSKAMPNSTVRSLEGQTHDVKAEVLAPVLAEFYK